MEECLRIDQIRIKNSRDSYCLLQAMGLSEDWVKMEKMEQINLFWYQFYILWIRVFIISALNDYKLELPKVVIYYTSIVIASSKNSSPWVNFIIHIHSSIKLPSPYPPPLYSWKLSKTKEHSERKWGKALYHDFENSSNITIFSCNLCNPIHRILENYFPLSLMSNSFISIFLKVDDSR